MPQEHLNKLKRRIFGANYFSAHSQEGCAKCTGIVGVHSEFDFTKAFFFS